MPEGDTIWKLAARLRPVLDGQPLERFDAPRLRGDRPRAGERIVGVEAVGKHLLIKFERGLVLETHLQMVGRWDVYKAGERWRLPAHLARVRIDVPGWQAVCFRAPTVRTYREGSASTPIDHLGPDLTSPDPDLALAAARLRSLPPETQVADALLDQRVANGVGNVFKSEVLFALGIDPFTPLSSIDDALALALVTKAHEQLLANVRPGRRATVGPSIAGAGPRLAVYGRARKPCLRCGTAIRTQRQGPHGRSTYWCPTCQQRPS